MGFTKSATGRPFWGPVSRPSPLLNRLYDPQTRQSATLLPLCTCLFLFILGWKHFRRELHLTKYSHEQNCRGSLTYKYSSWSSICCLIWFCHVRLFPTGKLRYRKTRHLAEFLSLLTQLNPLAQSW